MGAWGTGISSNDTYADVYDHFFDLYNDGLAVAEISTRLIRENQDTLNMPEDAPNFWYALAKAQWECKELDPEVKSRVDGYVKSGEDLQIWKQLGATQADLRAREKVLSRFLDSLSSEKTSAKKRKKRKVYDSVYEKGDCLVHKMDNGNYGGAFVLTDEKMGPVGVNYIAITTIDQPERPTLEDFQNADVYVRRAKEDYIQDDKLKSRWVDRPEITGYFASVIKTKTFDIEVIGKLDIYQEYFPETESCSSWIWLKDLLSYDDSYASINGRPTSTLKLATWVKKRRRFPILKWLSS